jgi:serine protease inhibitor
LEFPRVDHPYIIVIRERLTGTVFFMGKVVRMP